MARIRWSNYLSGFITVAVRGRYPEKIINLALSRGIFLWDLKKSTGELQFRVRNSSYHAIKNLAEEHNFEIHVVSQEGLPFYRQVLQRRRMLVLGALLFVVALYVLSSFVWFVEVSGQRSVPREDILKSAARHGLFEGACKWKFSRTEVEHGILKDLQRLSYVEVDIKGVKARIKVVEKILPEDDIRGYCHLVAARDGIITSVLVLEGQALVREGDTVSRGDILISGIVFPQPAEEGVSPEPGPAHPYMVRARGQVKARVWYEGYGECSLTTQRSVLTGRKAEKITLITPWKQFCLTDSRNSSFREAVRKTGSYIWATPWGEIGWRTVTSREKKTVRISRSDEEALEQARSQALKNLKGKIAAGEKIVDTGMDILSAPTEALIRVKARAEVIEDIGIPQPVNIEENTH